MRALVTGASGLLGSHFVERLHADGWAVRALVRDRSRDGWLSELGGECVFGDVLDAESLHRAMSGCDAVFHAAAAILPRGGWEAYREPNVTGTANVIEAAAGARARLLHVSSVAVYGRGGRFRGSGLTTESATLSPLLPDELYARSKRESEALVLHAHRSGRLWATAIRPDVIYGPRDRHFTPRAARLFSTRLAPLLRGGRSTLQIVHAANVADAAVRAIGSDIAGGKAYNTANDFDVTVREFIRLAAIGLGHPVVAVPIPMWAARAAMIAAQAAISAVKGAGAARMSHATIDFLTRDNPFSSDLAKRELGWAPPVPPEIGLPDTFRWWKASRA